MTAFWLTGAMTMRVGKKGKEAIHVIREVLAFENF